MRAVAKHRPECHVAYVEYKGNHQGNAEIYDVLIEKLTAWAAPKDLWHFPGRTQLIMIYPDDARTTPPDQQRLWLGIDVPEGIQTPEDEDIHQLVIPEGLYAVGSFEVQADEFDQAWGYLYGQWIPQNGYVPADGLAFEIQKNVSHEHPEHKHIIDICVPIQKRAAAGR